MGKTYGYVRVSSADQNIDRLGRDYREIQEQWRHLHIRKRQAKGIAAAKAGGVHMGRSRIAILEDFAIHAARWQKRELTMPQLRTLFGRGHSTVYKWQRERGFVRIVQPPRS